jgi:GABA permease
MSERILVISNETVEGDELREAILARAPEQVMVVAPALNSRLRYWLSDEDAARRAAEARLRRCLKELRRLGVPSGGQVGDADPMQAIEDAFGVFEADELLIATHPEERSHWLAHHLVERARAHFDLPVSHIVVNGAPAARPLARQADAA